MNTSIDMTDTLDNTHQVPKTVRVPQIYQHDLNYFSKRQSETL